MLCPRCYRRYEDDGQFCPHDGERLAKTVDIKRIRTQPAELQGTIINGRYQVRGLLGKGAMSQVFLAQDKTTGAPVAVKILEAKHLKDKRTVARFILEAKATAQIVHPGIVEMLDVGQMPGGAPYLVTEFLFGESLGTFVRREKLMKPEQGVPFVREVAEGLSAAHRAKIVHRDVKPDNVFLLGEKGSPHAAKVVDFGFAKLDEHGSVTQMGVTVGTVEYMAPEQVVSDPVDGRTDVYGLGVLMYRLFTGRLPFKDAEAPEMMAHQLLEAPPPLALANSPIGPGLEAIVRKAMRKRPEHRYASMADLVGDLNRLERAESLSARLPLEEADVYEPRTPYATKAAKFLHTKLGKPIT